MVKPLLESNCKISILLQYEKKLIWNLTDRWKRFNPFNNAATFSNSRKWRKVVSNFSLVSEQHLGARSKTNKHLVKIGNFFGQKHTSRTNKTTHGQVLQQTANILFRNYSIRYRKSKESLHWKKDSKRTNQFPEAIKQRIHQNLREK